MSLISKINDFVLRFLPRNKPVRCTTSKFIHDPIWGTIELLPYEHAILDTPLLQRLRQIHQTGFAYATYPCATHTRFEHTLGVVHLAGKMALQLQHKYQDRSADLRLTEKKTRLAALMHDTGHSSFSHTSEEIYRHCKDLGNLTSADGQFKGKGSGEVLSYLITTSKSFRSFFSNLKLLYPDELNIKLDDFAPLILGKPSDPRKQFEADIISGAFDADKLDYFPRDGRSAGIDLSLDIARLLHCMEIAEYTGPNGRKTDVLAVHKGGYNAIQQLLFARATLFSTVYHHHKVRACDCMIKGGYEVFKKKNKYFKKNAAFKGVDLKSAGDFLHITDADFFAEAYSHKAATLEHKIIHDVLYRRILKRALTISTKTVLDFDNTKDLYSAFLNLAYNPVVLRSLAGQIWRRAGKVGHQAYVWIDIPSEPNFQKAGYARINIAPRGITSPQLKPLAEFIPVKQWVDTYKTYLFQSYIFGPADAAIRLKIATAAADVLYKKFGFKLTIEAYAADIRSSVTLAQ